MKSLSIALLVVWSLCATACAFPDLPVPIDGSDDAGNSAEGGATTPESGTGEPADGDATVPAQIEGGDGSLGAADGSLEAADANDGALMEMDSTGPKQEAAAAPDGPTCTNVCTLGQTMCGSGS